MARVWSFNTTMRNPERMEEMLRALVELEGVPFDAKGQRLFFGSQIKKRLYKPRRITLGEADIIAATHSSTSADDLDDTIVERILAKYDGRDVDASGRGRTAAGILNRFGLCVALQSRGPVVITDLTKRWLEHEIEDDELFTKFFLKWQYPNEIEEGYDDFNIKPFIGTLALISRVNELWAGLGNKPVGVSKVEYKLFVTSLIKASQIGEYADRIVRYRTKKESLKGKDQADFIKLFTIDRVREIYGSVGDIDTYLSDLHDYMDSSIRYFRVSGLLALRGGDTHVDIALDKQAEVESILRVISPEAKKFRSYDDYFNFLGDISVPEFPWENDADLKKISANLSEALSAQTGGTKIVELDTIKTLPLRNQVAKLELLLNEARIEKLRSLKHDLPTLDECIERIQSIVGRNYSPLTARPSLDLEWYVSRALMVLNDAVSVLPSCKIGDDGIPTGFRANTSDIECRYKSFGMTVETTLLLGREQWYAEGQPVMRHLRDFEDKLEIDSIYCLFIAPLIHRDTLNTFWVSNVSGYEGEKQVIIPLTLVQFVEILKIARKKIQETDFTQDALHQLLSTIADDVPSTGNPHAWVAMFPKRISEWLGTV
ncbi:MAG: hypothetical protein UV20_C0019G0006 [Candidatus Magasanikbacteria bacterium GW2011_GWA2_42_32]|uniref:AlwI restriction endonuclease n=1 Tax=Candidatus Magasanikbacteria bacterium GW2011_GWA2_42_32 TaxID=1619039 RepID=A0A0G1A4P3_9BACT|nr:MAG: hypothetical protein UV20_C0019G0006 [Candidatus Magasanikbacteria bacterium GW2011_GWA2_42_32]